MLVAARRSTSSNRLRTAGARASRQRRAAATAMLPGPQIPQAGTVSFPARGHHHSTKEQYQMQREVASANERIASAEAFLQPHIRAEYVCGWHERMRRKVEENAAASEAAAFS